MYSIPNLTIQLQICLYMLITKKAGIEVSFVLKEGKRERPQQRVQGWQAPPPPPAETPPLFPSPSPPRLRLLKSQSPPGFSNLRLPPTRFSASSSLALTSGITRRDLALRYQTPLMLSAFSFFFLSAGNFVRLYCWMRDRVRSASSSPRSGSSAGSSEGWVFYMWGSVGSPSWPGDCGRSGGFLGVLAFCGLSALWVAR